MALLRSCAACMKQGLDLWQERALRQRAESIDSRAAKLAASLLSVRETRWDDLVQGHRAHRHAWHDELAERATIAEFAAFLLENWAFPAFLPLLERTRAVQITEAGRDAVDRNISDEKIPVPHAELMQRLVLAVKAKAGAEPQLTSYRSLMERTFVFYHGYYSDPWYLVGALYATEALARHRVTRMGTGLRRLGLDAADLEFIRIHSVCDDDHASDWRESVIAATVAVRPALRTPIAVGVAACLESSAVYFDELLARAKSARRAGGAS
jgi:hypothetical protein